MTKDTVIHVRSTQDTKDKLTELANHYRRSQADQIAWMIDREIQKMKGEQNG